MNLILLVNIIDFVKEKILGIHSDIDLLMMGLKMVVLLFIVSFVRGRFGGGPIVTILVLILGYVILFQYWMLFGPMMLIYLFIVFGFTAILLDLVIARPWAGEPGAEGPGGTDTESFRRRFRGRF